MNAVAEIKTSPYFDPTHVFEPKNGFYLVVSALGRVSVYRVLFKKDIYGPIVVKVASSNFQSKVKLGERLKGGELLVINIVDGGEGHVFESCLLLGNCKEESPGTIKIKVVSHTPEIIALALSANEAIEILGSDNLEPWDDRFIKKTRQAFWQIWVVARTKSVDWFQVDKNIVDFLRPPM